MATSIRVTTLAVVIGACLGGSVWTSNAVAAGVGEQTTPAVNTYLIRFEEPGALHYQGGIANLRATAPDPTARSRKFDAKSVDSTNYRNFLRERQKAILQRWDSGEDHGGVTIEELKALLADWKGSQEKPPRKPQG